MASGQKLGRPFWVFWSAVTATNVGDGIRLVALPLLATQVTENPTFIALVTVFMYVPALIFGQVAGVFVDRVRKRRLIALSPVGRAVVLAFVAVAIALGMLDITMLCVAAFLYGAGEAVSDPASHAILQQSQSLKVKRSDACARYISPGVRIRALSCYGFFHEEGRYAEIERARGERERSDQGHQPPPAAAGARALLDETVKPDTVSPAAEPIRRTSVPRRVERPETRRRRHGQPSKVAPVWHERPHCPHRQADANRGSRYPLFRRPSRAQLRPHPGVHAATGPLAVSRPVAGIHLGRRRLGRQPLHVAGSANSLGRHHRHQAQARRPEPNSCTERGLQPCRYARSNRLVLPRQKPTSDEIHGVVAVHEAIELGHFRGEGQAGGGHVSIGERGTYMASDPGEGGETLIEEFRDLIDYLDIVEDPRERAFAYFAAATHRQFCFDGNKRTSRIMMAGTLMAAGYDATNLMRFIIDSGPGE